MLNNTKQFQINTCNETITRSAAAARKKCLSKQITTVNLKQRSAQPKKYHRHDTEGKKMQKRHMQNGANDDFFKATELSYRNKILIQIFCFSLSLHLHSDVVGVYFRYFWSFVIQRMPA